MTRGPPDCMQEEELRSSEALVADLQKSLQQKDSELEPLRANQRQQKDRELAQAQQQIQTVGNSSCMCCVLLTTER